MNDQTWRADAACVGEPTEAFFADERWAEVEGRFVRWTHASELDAKALCAVCPVRDDCLDHAMTLPERHGVWGGLNARERDRLRRKRQRRRAS